MTDPIPEFINPKEYPNFWEQMKNFSEFAKKVGQEKIKGEGLFLTDQEYDERISVCEECSQFNKESKRCYMCGCFMQHKPKFRTSECPLSKW